MPSRRDFLRTAAIAGAAGIASPALTDARAAFDDGTWLTYAVNVEMTFNKLPFLERLKKVSESGFSHYEFWQWKTKDLPAIKKANEELNLTPTQFSAFWGITDAARKEPFFRAVDEALAAAEFLGVKQLCVVAGEVAPKVERDEQFENVIEAIKAVVPKLEEADVTLILEPLNVLVDHPKQLVVTTEDAIRVMKGVDSKNVKILFDVYHQQISEGNLSGNIKKNKDYIGYYQIADHPGRHEPNTGEINYAHVLRTIHDVGYQGAIGLELSPKSDPAAALKAVREADAAAKARA